MACSKVRPELSVLKPSIPTVNRRKERTNCCLTATSPGHVEGVRAERDERAEFIADFAAYVDDALAGAHDFRRGQQNLALGRA